MDTPKIIRPQPSPIAPGDLPKAAAKEPLSFVLFGATGDLSGRKILPALFALWQGKFLPENFLIVGVAIDTLTDDQFRDRARKGIAEHGRLQPANDDEWKRFADRLFYQPVNFGNAESYQGLAKRLNELEPSQKLPGNRLFYLAISPSFFAPVIGQLSGQKLVRPDEPGKPWSRVVIEKPFGHDLASALALDKDIHEFLEEDQIYRIDHYLGKETVQNLIAFRFGNAIFEPIMRNAFVDQVQITMAETVGMEGSRGGYYDHSGCLRDVVQNHLLQLLSYVAMDAPGGLKSTNIRTEKLRILRNLLPIEGAEVASKVVRGQYRAGTVEGQAVKAYRDEIAVPKTSNTETYVALRIEIDTWRWAGVPFLIRSGKRLPSRATEVAVHFKRQPLRHPEGIELELDGGHMPPLPGNVLTFRIQPNEGISLSFVTKKPGMSLAVRPVQMDFDYEHSFHLGMPEAYERLILDAMKGFQLLFMHADEVDAQWTFVNPILDAWAKETPKLPNYDAGSWGPKEADKLLEGCEGTWREP